MNDYFADASILIRKPVDEVFQAFVDPDVTTKFWFTHGTGILEQGKNVDWIWEMYDLTVPVYVKTLVPNKEIVVDLGSGEQHSIAKFTFEARDDQSTAVFVINYDFKEGEDKIMDRIRDSTGGFNLVLAAAKAWLEHGIMLHVVRDKA